jgi:hypothetical protein
MLTMAPILAGCTRNKLCQRFRHSRWYNPHWHGAHCVKTHASVASFPYWLPGFRSCRGFWCYGRFSPTNNTTCSGAQFEPWPLQSYLLSCFHSQILTFYKMKLSASSSTHQAAVGPQMLFRFYSLSHTGPPPPPRSRFRVPNICP